MLKNCMLVTRSLDIDLYLRIFTLRGRATEAYITVCVSLSVNDNYIYNVVR